MSKEPKLKSNLVGPDKIISKFVEDYKDTFFQKTRSMAQRNDLLFFEEGEELFRQGSDSYKSYSISFYVKNDSPHRFAKNLICSFIKKDFQSSIYLEIWWFQSPGAKMICFSESLSESIFKLEEKEDTFRAAIEYSVRLVENLK